jgi:sugar porter (SP) family MFS transporter
VDNQETDHRMETVLTKNGQNFSPYLVLVAGSAAISGLLFGYDTAVINGALVYLRSEFHLTPFKTEMVASVLLWGCAAGAAIAGYTSDRYGRRAVLFVAGVLFCLSSLGSALPTHLWQLILARAVGGLAIGSASLIAPLYIAEIAPSNLRGRLVTLNQLAIVCGVLVAFVSNGVLAHLANNWRWMFGLGALPSVVLCLSLLWVPESPRWLVQHGRLESARATLQRISTGDTEAQLEEMSRAIDEERGSLSELLSPSLRKPLLLTIMLAIIQQVTGINTILYYGAIIFADQTNTEAGRAVSMNVSVGIINLVFTVAALLLIDRLGRRPLLLTATAGMAVCMTIFAAMLHLRPEHSALLLIPVLGYVACFAFGLGAGVWVCLAEFFPNHIRGRAMSIATVALWLSVSLVTATFLTLIRYFSAPTVFLGYALLCAASFAYIYRQLPETKNRTLEEIQSLW